MKPKEYLDRFGSDLDSSSERGEFAKTLIQEFDEDLKKSFGYKNIQGYEQSIRVLRSKWDGIGNVRGRVLDEKIWKYIYASYIAPIREEIFPEEMKKRAKVKKQRQEWQEWDRMHDPFEDLLTFKEFIDDVFKNTKIIGNGMSTDKALQVLELSNDYTIDDLKKVRRILALKHHPDVGGSVENMKDINLAYEILERNIRRRNV